MKQIKITQVKSAIDRPNRQKLTLQALGLKKLNASRQLQATDQILGMVRTVNHLLKVEDVQTNETEITQLKSADTEEHGSSQAEVNVQNVNFIEHLQPEAPDEAAAPESMLSEGHLKEGEEV